MLYYLSWFNQCFCLQPYHDLQEISEFHVNRSYLSVGLSSSLKVKRVFLLGFNSRDSDNTKPEGGFKNLRTLRGTLESKLQRNRVYGMLGFVVPGPLCYALEAVIPRYAPGMLGNVVSGTSHSATCSLLRALVRLAAGAGPWSL